MIEMGITLNNTGDSGTTNITLKYVSSYGIQRSKRYASLSIPRKTDPTIDADTWVVNPSIYRITAIITDTEKSLLETFNTERDSVCLLSDGSLSNISVGPEMISFSARTGYVDFPWLVTIELKGLDN